MEAAGKDHLFQEIAHSKKFVKKLTLLPKNVHLPSSGMKTNNCKSSL